MLRKCISLSAATVLTAGILIAGQAAAQQQAAAPAPAPTKPTVAKVCANCHQPESGNLRGNFDSVAYKTKSIQVKIDEATEILWFDDTLKIENLQAPADMADQPLRSRTLVSGFGWLPAQPFLSSITLVLRRWYDNRGKRTGSNQPRGQDNSRSRYFLFHIMMSCAKGTPN